MLSLIDDTEDARAKTLGILLIPFIVIFGLPCLLCGGTFVYGVTPGLVGTVKEFVTRYPGSREIAVDDGAVGGDWGTIVHVRWSENDVDEVRAYYQRFPGLNVHISSAATYNPLHDWYCDWVGFRDNRNESACDKAISLLPSSGTVIVFYYRFWAG